MSTVLEQQGEIIDVIEGDAAVVEKDLETGHVSKPPPLFLSLIIIILYL